MSKKKKDIPVTKGPKAELGSPGVSEGCTTNPGQDSSVVKSAPEEEKSPQQLLVDRIEKTTAAIHRLLEAQGLTLTIEHNIRVVPKKQR